MGLNYDFKTSRDGSGQIYYQSLNSSSSYFTQAQAYINRWDSTFRARNVFMVTYDRVLPYAYDCFNQSSFQIFLSTDGKKNYVALKYELCPTSCPNLRTNSSLNRLNGEIFEEWFSFLSQKDKITLKTTKY